MANRFVRRIKSGDIASIEDLKSEFKELAKLTHPDVRGPGSELEFASVRTEYEAALHGFEKHRFGAGRSGDRRGPMWAQGANRAEARGSLPDEAWLCLGLLLKRGFPKLPRHEKEGLRYDYARWRFVQALGSSRGGPFDAFEAGLLALKGSGSDALAPVMRLLVDLIDYRRAGLSDMRTGIVLSIGRLGLDPRVDPGIRAFVALLASDLGMAGELGGPAGTRGQ